MEEKLWKAVLATIKPQVSGAIFKTWFEPTSLARYSDEVATVTVSNVFSLRQFEVRYNDLVKESFATNGRKPQKIQYKVQPSATSKRKPVSREIPPEEVATITAPKPTVQPSTPGHIGNSLNKKYTFDTFIVGSSNDLAFTACQTVAKNPGTKYNPLFIYGGVGLGKTHLLQAVGNEIQKNDPKAQVLYISTETFVKDFLEHIMSKKNGFSYKYRNVDVLIIDDMQFIANKEKTQEEFFHTFNALHQANKQIIIGSDKPPRSIPTLTDRLRSRLEWGMPIDVQMPDFETRCAIVRAKSEQSNIHLDSATVDFLANSVKTNIRELEGTLNQLLAYAEMRGISPSIDIAEGLLGDVKSSRPQHITAKQIVDKTARYFQLDPKDICSARRDKQVATPRQIAMYLLRSELRLSFPMIAKQLGRKDHTTAMHSINKIEKSIKLDPAVREHIADIKDVLYA